MPDGNRKTKAQLLDEVRRLRESEERYRAVIEGTADLITVMDPEGRFIYANHVARRAFGVAPEQCAGLLAFDFVHPDDRERTVEWFGECAKTRCEHASIENRQVNRETGAVTDMLWTASFHFHEDGRLRRVEGIARDFTDRKRSEENLRQIAERYDLAVGATNDGIWDWLIETDEVYFSSRFCEILGYSLDDPDLAHDFDAWGSKIHPDDHGRVMDALTGHLQEGLDYDVEYQHRHRSGEYRWQRSKGKAILDERGKPVRVVGTISDITERKQAEVALHKSQQQLSLIYDSVGDLLYFIAVEPDDTFRFLSINREFLNATKLTEEDIVGKRIDEVVPEQSISMVRDNYKKAIEEKTIVRWEEVSAYPAGLKVGEVTIAPVFNDEGVCTHLVGSVHEITELRRLEEERQHLERQVQQAQKLESLGVMAGGIAHDFNNILYAILGNADIALADMPPGAVGRDSVQEIQTAAQRAAELTDQMLAYSGGGALAVEKFDLSGLVRDMTQLLDVAHTKRAIVRYRLEDELPAIQGDASQVRQVVMNLITNASEAVSDEGGIITVTTAVTEATLEYLAATYAHNDLPGGRYVFLEVTDTGCGMDTETIRRMFDPFFTTKFTGRGLGLAAVLGIVRAHRGAIDIQSEVDHGTTIKVLFPALDEAAKPPVKEAPREEGWSAHGTVLVVDDEPQIRSLLKSVLERKGFTVLTAEDGRQATDVFRDNRDDIVCVLLDLTMPNMGGEETHLELRRLHEDVRVILISGYSEAELGERVGALDFAGFLKKPVGSGELLEMIRAVLQRREDA